MPRDRPPQYSCTEWPDGSVILNTLQSKILSLIVLGGVAVWAKPAQFSTTSDVYARVIQTLGGRVVNASAYPNTVAGFQKYLADTGISAVSAAELTRPNHPQVAARLGFQNFLPQQSWWSRGAALAILTQNIESQIGDSVYLRNWWRPAAYNSDPAVAGARDGDHPTACAIDLDYKSASERARAEQFLRALNARCPWMQMSLGIGAQTTHIGIASPKGHREWHYASLASAPAGLRS